jgi:phospholipid/cholesterol/gamma-HCH transport system permease protein
MYAGLLGGIPVLLGLGFPLRMVLHQIQSSLHFGDLAEGIAKSIVFGAIVASVSCLRGLQTGEGLAPSANPPRVRGQQHSVDYPR